LSGLLLLLIGLVSPWVVHLAPPPAGVVSILAVKAMSGGGGLSLGRGGTSRRRPSARDRRDQEDLTGEV